MGNKISTRATSGARLVGDDEQHMIVWYHALQTQADDNNINELRVEATDAGNIDDLVVIRDGKLPDEYWQIKASVDATSPLDEKYLTSKYYHNGDSLLARIYKSWLKLEHRSDAELPRAVLATTKAILLTDSVLSQLTTDDGRLVYAMAQNVEAKRRWADHLHISGEELNNFLESFEVRPSLLPGHLKEFIKNVSLALGLRYDDSAIAAGVQVVRGWIKGGRRTLTPSDIRETIEKLGIEKPVQSGLLVVQMGDTNPRAASTKYALDFIKLFDGHDSASRRRLIDPQASSEILSGLQSMRQLLRADGIYDIEVDGPMRCPLWFLTGKVLSETSAVAVKAKASTGTWSSAHISSNPVDLQVVAPNTLPAQTRDLAVSVNLSLDISEDVDDYLMLGNGDIPHVKFILGKPGSRSIKSPSHAQSIAIAVRQTARQQCRKLRVEKVHLFLGMPGQAALLIGHAWNRLPETVLYWDMGKPGSYSPAFTV